MNDRGRCVGNEVKRVVLDGFFEWLNMRREILNWLWVMNGRVLL